MPATSKKNKYCMEFNDSWCNEVKFIQKSCRDEGFALSTMCAHGGESDINRHKNTVKHKRYVYAVYNGKNN